MLELRMVRKQEEEFIEGNISFQDIVSYYSKQWKGIRNDQEEADKVA